MRSLIWAVSAFVAFANASAPSSQTIVRELDPAPTPMMPPTPGVWCESFITGAGVAGTVDLMGSGGSLEADQPLPRGAMRLTTTLDNNDRANVGVSDNYGQLGNVFSSLQLTYSSFKASNGTQNLSAAPALKLTITDAGCDDPSSMGDCFGTLVFEPTWNQPGFEGASTLPPLDTWQDWVITPDQGVWWWTGGFGEPGTAGSGPHRTLNEWKALFDLDPNFAGARITSVQIGLGNGQAGIQGYFDSVRVQHAFGAGYSECFDFEPIVDCNGNLVHDALDISEGTIEDCNGNDVPDECDIASATSDDCDGNMVPDECQPGSAMIYGSGVNPAGSLTIVGGTAAIGTTLIVALDNPVGTQGSPSIPFLFVANTPDVNFPAGTPIPNFGMNAPGAAGELLISLTPPNPFTPVLSGPPWLGSPTPISIPLPNDCTLIGDLFFAQGVLVDPTRTVPNNRFGLTDAIVMDVGF